MLKRTTWLWRLAACVVLPLIVAVAPPARAADDKDPQKAFEDVFGESYRKALASPAIDDDVSLAKDLSKAVQTVEMPASLIQVIATKMESLAEKAPGAILPTVEAMEKLVATDAKLKPEVAPKIVALLEKAHASNDSELRSAAGVKLLSRLIPLADQEVAERKLESAVARYRQALKLARETGSNEIESINAKLAAAGDLLKRAAEVDALEKKIEANPKDAESRLKLIRIHLVERNDPSAAVWFIGDGVDETTKRLLPVAAKDGAGAEPRTLADLGAWYLDLANDASPAAKLPMLTKAKGYYDRFVAVHKDNDLLKAKATLSLEQINKKIKEAEASASTASNPPTTASPGTADRGAGALTVAIDGPTITEPDRVERLYSQHSRVIAKYYLSIGSDFMPALEYDAKFPSSAGETVAAVTKRMTTTKDVRDGLLVRRVTVPPVPAEAEAVAMALPSFDKGAYGYIHSAEVAEIVGGEEMVVKNVWLLDPQTLNNAKWDERTERDKLRRRQDDFNWSGPGIRLHGFPTAGLKVGERVGMVGKGKPLQIIIVGTEKLKDNYFKPNRPVAALTSKLTRGGLDDKQFDELLAKRNLTRTDFVNIFLEAQRTSVRDTIANTVRRIEAKGAKTP